MRVLIPLYLLTLSCTPSLHAETSESKQWFNAINYSKVNNESRNYESEAYTVASRYYFSPQEHSGVWDDFGYLDTDSNIAINYANDSFSNSNGIFGEGFYSNVFSTLEIANLSETSDYSLGFGYLFADA
ncbi:putative porin [Pseudoalteromonas aliena]|uniref:putative porin n=1 Tax=Pseudoalteromonas aliena TaxID=247523 RepID=UPI00249524CA|nr:putative porin [Pseudoalteromonas aliena]